MSISEITKLKEQLENGTRTVKHRTTRTVNTGSSDASAISVSDRSGNTGTSESDSTQRSRGTVSGTGNATVHASVPEVGNGQSGQAHSTANNNGANTGNNRRSIDANIGTISDGSGNNGNSGGGSGGIGGNATNGSPTRRTLYTDERTSFTGTNEIPAIAPMGAIPEKRGPGRPTGSTVGRKTKEVATNLTEQTVSIGVVALYTAVALLTGHDHWQLHTGGKNERGETLPDEAGAIAEPLTKILQRMEAANPKAFVKANEMLEITTLAINAAMITMPRIQMEMEIQKHGSRINKAKPATQSANGTGNPGNNPTDITNAPAHDSSHNGNNGYSSTGQAAKDDTTSVRPSDKGIEIYPGL